MCGAPMSPQGAGLAVLPTAHTAREPTLAQVHLPVVLLHLFKAFEAHRALVPLQILQRQNNLGQGQAAM